MVRKTGLGRNLNALLGEKTAIVKAQQQPAVNNVQTLPVNKLQRGQYQPRQTFEPEALNELATSIKAQGIIQPIVVRSVAGQQYEIIAGERRWRAAQIAELKEVPVIIRDMSDQTAMALALIENIQREDLNPLEESRALHRLAEEFSLTHQQVGEAVGKKRTTVTNLLRLMTLPGDVQRFLEHGDIEMGHAKALLGLPGDKISFVASQVVAKGLSVRDTEKYVRQVLNPHAEQPPTTAKKPIDKDVASLQQRLSQQLCAKVALQHSKQGKGKLVIHYNNLDELDGILRHFPLDN